MRLIIDYFKEEMFHDHDHSNLHHDHDHDHDHGHDHDHSHEAEMNRLGIAMLVIGAVMLLAAMLLKGIPALSLFLYIGAYIIIGGPVLLRAGHNISRGRIFDENFLMSIATIGAFAIGQYGEGVSVMLFYQIGEMFQDLALNRSRKSIAELMDIRPDFAVVKTEAGEERVNPEEVQIGQLILVRPGERIPLDGVVSQGNSILDVSALTGESMPKNVAPGDLVYSGSINKEGLLLVEVTKLFGESTVARILELVEEAGDRKAPTEKFITKFAAYYTPFVVFSALGIALIPPLLAGGVGFAEWLRRALIFLVVSCPCALVISIPLGFFGGIGAASKEGILVKGGNFLEALNNIDTVVFDKTGTLTKGVFKVTEIKSKGNLTEEELLRLAAHGESYSNHPIGKSIVEAYEATGFEEGQKIAGRIDKGKISSYEEIAGHGIKVTVDGKKLLLGNRKLVENAWEILSGGTVVHMEVDGEYAGYIKISDQIKPDSKKTIEKLKALGVGKTVMLTGDSQAEGQRVGKELGLDEVYAELLPQEKVEILEALEKKIKGKGRLIFVGDGINDAPVLIRAHVGVAMGGLGSDAAIEAADIVLMTDEPSKIIKGIEIAGRTRKIVWQNIIFAMGVKAIVLLLGAFGLATMWEAVFADVGVALLAILNAMRVKTSATAIGGRNRLS